MKSIFGFIIEPIGGRYNNVKKLGEKELVLNTDIFNHKYINRKARVISAPILNNTTGIKSGDEIIVHHNVFRRWHNQAGIEKNSSSFISENRYNIYADQIYAVRCKDTWRPLDGYIFLQPLKETNDFSVEKEKFIGEVVYGDKTYKKGDILGFVHVGARYEFVIDGQRLYKVNLNQITIKYEYQGNEETYNPSWA
jgi:hypothetical protein